MLLDWAKDKTRKSFVDSYEEHSLEGKRKIKPFSFLENGTKNSQAGRCRARLNQTK